MATPQSPNHLLDPKRVFIIAEAGSNWRMGTRGRDLEMAKRLIGLAAKAGADAVKFQLFRAETTYAMGSGPCGHLKKKGISDDIGAVFKDLELPDEMIPELAHECGESGVQFIASTFSRRDFETIDPYVQIHKIASPELHYPELLELVARTGKPTLLSTGISTEDEIEWALERWHGGLCILLQCTVQYPTEPKAVHLRALERLRERFGVPVGLSDHSRDPVVAPVAAVAMGARVVEKHFTLHRGLVGPDHSWAITADELQEMVRAIRLAEEMLGEPMKQILPQEQPLRRFSRRSVQTVRDIAIGEKLELGENLAVLRPGTCPQGVHPRHLDQIEGALAARAISCGGGVQKGDWVDET